MAQAKALALDTAAEIAQRKLKLKLPQKAQAKVFTANDTVDVAQPSLVAKLKLLKAQPAPAPRAPSADDESDVGAAPEAPPAKAKRWISQAGRASRKRARAVTRVNKTMMKVDGPESATAAADGPGDEVKVAGEKVHGAEAAEQMNAMATASPAPLTIDTEKAQSLLGIQLPKSGLGDQTELLKMRRNGEKSLTDVGWRGVGDGVSEL